MGSLVKQTKQYFQWRFTLDARQLVSCELFSSKLSGRKKFFVNGQLKDEQ